MDTHTEYFDVVDEADEVIGRLPRPEVHRLGLRHRAVHALVFNRAGQVYLQRRSLKKECSPGMWDSSSAGHVESGEHYDACVLRELEEEIGLRLEALPTRLFKLEASPQTGMEFCWVYRCEAEGPFVPDPVEIMEARWFEPAEVEALVARRPRAVSGSLTLIWARLRADGLL